MVALAIIYLSLTSMLMVSLPTLYVINVLALLAVSAWLNDRRVYAAWLVALLFYPAAARLSAVNALHVLSLPFYAVAYMSARRLSRGALVRQVRVAGWVSWAYCAVVVLAQAAQGLTVNPGLGFFHRSYGALFLVLLLALGDGGTWYWVAGSTCCAVSAIYSRAGLIALGVVLAGRVCAARPWVRWIALAAALSSPSLVLIRPRTALVRVELWRDAVSTFTRHWWGIGWGRTHLYSHVEGQFAAYAHNQFLTFLLELGVGGVLAMGGIGAALWRTRDNRPRGANLALMAVAAHGLVDDPLRFWHIAILVAIAIATGDYAGYRGYVYRVLKGGI